MKIDNYVAPPTTFEELVRRLGANFSVEVTYWDHDPPKERTEPWGVVVVWAGPPRNALEAWATACLQRAPGFGPSRKMVVAEVFAVTLDVAAMAAWDDAALRLAVSSPEQIDRWVYDPSAERFVPGSTKEQS